MLESNETATRTLDLLRCPSCGGRLSEQGADKLECESGHTYPVVRDIPRLFDKARLSLEQSRTADAFGYSWTHYPKENPYTEEQWRDWVEPLTREDFDGRLVLDAGCGLCGFAEFALDWGAREVVGIDLSQAIDAARDRLGDRVGLVQGDLNEMPFEPGTFDIAYSIGVLHHLPDPERGFQSLARMARPGGKVFAWVYGRENNGWIVHIVDPLRRHVFSRLPRAFVKWGISLPVVGLLWPAIKLAGRLKKIPYGDYLRWLGERDLEFVHGVVFDHLVAPTSHYIRREEFEEWFRRGGLEDVKISWRNQNSWRGLGTVPGGPPDALPADG
ncbi:MAG TPA: methyltransferase domain-containing protein [Thermoleophilaceae bacterium]